MKTHIEIVRSAIEVAGQAEVARKCNVTPPAVHKWQKNGLPRTEWTGETKHAEVISELCVENGSSEYTVDRLLTSKSAA